MDDILSLIVVAVIYLIAASGKKKKKSKQKTARARGFKTAFDAQQAPNGQTYAHTHQASPAAAQPSLAHPGDCEDRPIHLHDVPQSVMHAAGEGEDPCHAGGMDAKKGEDVKGGEDMPSMFGEPDSGAVMQDMLRGMIMSEILTRPCERRAAERNRRSYHG